MRLDKYLAHCGFGTRKEVKKLIRAGVVTCNGKIVSKDDVKINEICDVICVDQQEVCYEKYVYYMLNKPSGVVSATMDDTYATVLECFDCFLPADVFPIGRLDLDTEGLLLISNDGALAHDLLSPKKHVDKVYYVECEKDLTEDMIQILENEIVLKDEVYQPGKVLEYANNTCQLAIQEGKFHQVKRMLHAANNEVTYLKRIAFGPLVLDDDLKIGEYRKLSEAEINALKQRKSQ